MKKTYMNPEIQVVEIKTAGMLATSPGLNGTYGGGTVYSRDLDFDEDEDEEDY